MSTVSAEQALHPLAFDRIARARDPRTGESEAISRHAFEVVYARPGVCDGTVLIPHESIASEHET